MDFKEHFHRNAGTIITNTESYNNEYKDLTDTLLSITDFDLVDEFHRIKKESKKQSEKSLSKPINNILKDRLVALGWEPEAEIFRDDEYTKDKKGTTWRLDFAKRKYPLRLDSTMGEISLTTLSNQHWRVN